MSTLVTLVVSLSPFTIGCKNQYEEVTAFIGEPPPARHFKCLVAQQDMQALHRIRERRVKMRTALVNQIRGLLSEYGIVMPKGVSQVRHKLPFILEDADNGLSWAAHEWLQSLQAELSYLDEQIQSTTGHHR